MHDNIFYQAWSRSELGGDQAEDGDERAEDNPVVVADHRFLAGLTDALYAHRLQEWDDEQTRRRAEEAEEARKRALDDIPF